jgi:hypothetical protein
VQCEIKNTIAKSLNGQKQTCKLKQLVEHHSVGAKMSQTTTFAILVGDTNVLYELESGDHALFLTIGIAVSQIQSLEVTMTSLLTSLELHSVLKNRSVEPIEKTASDHSEKTLGTVIRLFREYIKDHNIAEALEKARVSRNHIVHHILKKYGWPFLSASNYLDAIREVDNATRDIASADDAVVRYMAENRPIPFYAVIINHETGEIEPIQPKADG